MFGAKNVHLDVSGTAFATGVGSFLAPTPLGSFLAPTPKELALGLGVWDYGDAG